MSGFRDIRTQTATQMIGGRPAGIVEATTSGTMQKIGDLLGLQGSFAADYGTDHIIQAIKDLYPDEPNAN